VQRIFFKKLHGLGDVFDNSIAPIYKNQIPIEPVMGVLWIDAIFKNIPPVNKINFSPVGAHIGGLTFGIWSNVNTYLSEHRKASKELFKKALSEEFYANINSICKDPWMNLALTSLLFTEGQMKVFSNSPFPAQEVLLKLLEPLVINREVPLNFPEIKPGFLNQVNAQIEVVLLAGNKPMVNTFHPASTTRRWLNELEAATVLLIPQVLIATEASLPAETRNFFLNALNDEVKEWQLWLPTIRSFQNWNWLPTLME
jgi:hypothetical protein